MKFRHEKMKKAFLLVLAFMSLAVNAEDDFTQEMIFVELNCENLFDCQHDSLKQDEEFLPDGAKQWTYSRYWKKINNTGRTILACGEREDGSFAIPDFVALCEVENDTVLRDLTQRSILRNAKYKYIATESPDVRGIDVALLFSPMSFMLIKHYSIRINPIKDMRPTRDILYAKGLIDNGDTLHIFVVHAPSRSGGEYETRHHRKLVNERLQQSVDSVFSTCGTQAKIIVAGDFNDYSVTKFHPNLHDVSEKAVGRNGAKGTYKYRGVWGNLDHILLSDAMNRQAMACSIGDAEFLMTDDENYGGKQPFRNYIGPIWKNGFSDHLPLILKFRQKE